jgi:dTDP-4-amino-4,6-dideoxygalactose transaminase
MPALTFVAPANAIRYVGATPALFDVEPRHRQLDVERLSDWLNAECIRSADGVFTKALPRRRVAAVMPVHLYGHPFDVDALRAVTDSFGLPVIEDAAEALGARVRGNAVGAHGDLSCFSFNANKIATGGGGGIVVGKDPAAEGELRTLSNQAKQAGPRYLHKTVGFNYKVGSATAALAVSQLKKLDRLVELKRRIAHSYSDALADLPGIEVPREAPWARSTFWLYTIHVDPSRFGMTAEALGTTLAREGIATRPAFTPLHELPPFRDCLIGSCPVAERLSGTGLTLPSSSGLRVEEVDRVIAAVQRTRAARTGAHR